ncbi:hypothetical protein GBAR_LOCUS30683 [Geodia barretti]|uniref:Uncharacterized protein n=1 Tax=Geodia barretti TaxID=519541 RepID=A0AA35TXK1_GEOBA|nr:hypothetical protein GBAR_LOCUS30683 [Geodia barretti]
MSSSSTASGDDGSRRQLSVARIFSDENGETHFGSFTISMTGSGKGHYSRSVDGRPRHSIFIPVPDDFVAQDS